MLADLYKLYKVLSRAGVLYPDAFLAASQFLWSYLCFGSSLATLAKWAALRFPNHIAIKDEHKQVTFRELVANSEALAVGLEQTHNIKPNQTIGLLGRNSVDFVEMLLACEMLGVNIVLLPTSFVNETLEHLQKQQKANLFICDDEFRQTLEVMTNPLPKTVYFSSLPKIKIIKPGLVKPKKKSNLILLTSGTTGHPKVIRQRPKMTLKTLVGLLETLQLKANSKTLLTVPLLHGQGLAALALCFAFGSSLYLFRKSSTEDFLHCLEQNTIDTLVLVPTILYRLLQEQETFQVRKIISGSAPLSEMLATQTLDKFGDVLYNLYGSSETGLISLATPSDLRAAPRTVGNVLPGVTLQFENDRIQILKNKIFFDTGDTGYLEANRLFLLGRSDDMLICGGENVYPRLVEEKVNRLEYIQESAAIGVPDAEYGQAVHLFVVLKKQATLEKITKDLESLFPRAMRPKKIFIVEGLPKTSVGKVMKHRLNPVS